MGVVGSSLSISRPMSSADQKRLAVARFGEQVEHIALHPVEVVDAGRVLVGHLESTLLMSRSRR